MSLKLIIDSDLHFKNGKIRHDKINHVEIINSVPNVDAVICAGDLTDSGFDGKKILCWAYGGNDDQITPLKNFITNIKYPIYLCMGNHDNYVPFPGIHKPVADLIKEKHSSLLYSWDIVKDNIYYHFICLDVYPNEEAIKFLKRELINNKKKIFIIYFHYCITGLWSGWWSDEEKAIFYDTIKNYNVKLIIVGHRHANWMDSWNGITIVSGSGSKVLVCNISAYSDTYIEQI